MSGTDGLPSISANESFSMDSDVAKRFCHENRELCEICALLAYNKTYIELLDDLIAKADEAVTQNRNMQAVIKKKLARPNGGQLGARRRQRDFGLRFRYPYFRDASGMVPAQNEEALQVSHLCSVNPLMDEEKKWKEKELRMLKEAVAQSLNEQQIIKLDAKKEVIARKLRSAGVETTEEQMENWRNELERIKNRINYVRGRPVDEVIQEASGDFSLVDWAKIAASVFQGSRSIIQLKQKWHCDVMFDQGAWTIVEDEKLMSLGSDLSNWDSIAQHLNTNRSAFRCFQRHSFLQDQFKEKRSWTPKEDDKLLSYVRLFKVGEQIPWAKVSMYMEGRSKQSCELRYARSLNETLRHGRWSEAEDLLLLQAINKYGPQNWGKIANLVSGRSTLQCRDRWIHVLDHKRRDMPWGWEEHQRLLYGVTLFGRNECAKIAKLLPGRNNMDARMRIRLLVKYKIEENVNPKSYVFRHFANNYIFYKMRRALVIEKFQDYLETEQHSQKNQLHARLGLGTYVADYADYTDVKKERLVEFGQWTVSGSGRWVSILQKNPNEYDKEDLMEELDKLSEETRVEAIEWIRKSDERLELERQMEKTIPDDPVEANEFYERMFPEERLKELSQLVGKLLKPTPNDIFYYNRYKKRPGKLKLKKEKGYNIVPNLRQKLSRRRKEKLAKLFRTTECGEDIDVNGLRWSERMIIEINSILNELPKKKRREYVIRSLCNAIRQRIHRTNVALLKAKPAHRDNMVKLIHDYVETVINDPPEPPVVLKPELIKEKQIVLLPQNWQNLSLKEMMQYRIAPNIYPALVQHATRHLPEVIGQQQFEAPKPTFKKRRRLDTKEDFNGGFRETVVCPMPENQTFELGERAKLREEPPTANYETILNKLVPPCIATTNAIEMFDNRARNRLVKWSLVSCPTNKCDSIGIERPSTSAHPPPSSLVTPPLSQRRCVVPETARHTSEYALLRKRMFRLFFLPLLMQRAIKANEVGDESVDFNLEKNQ